MAEFLVCATDQVSGDFYENAQLMKRGDVVSIKRDGFMWGRIESVSANYRVLAVPGPRPDAFPSLLAREADPTPETYSKVLQFRGFYINFEALPPEPGLAEYLASGPRTKSRMVLQGGVEALQAAIATRPALVDPNP